MKIDKNKPLPDHTKLDYDECCALLTLKELFPDEYGDLKLSDKPDLQGAEVGVEVTIADDRVYQETLNNWVKAVSCDDEKQKEKYIERMKQLGTPYTGGVQTWPQWNPSFSDIQTAVMSKVKKLGNGGYKFFQTYELFIFSDVWIHGTIIADVMELFCDNHVFDFYKKVFILEKGYILHIFTVRKYTMVEIDITEQSERNKRARKMVEDAEEQE